MATGKLTREYKEKNFDAKWMYYWYILKAPGASSSELDLSWHEWMEKENTDFYHQLINEADKEFQH